jgi:hypothetical protein
MIEYLSSTELHQLTGFARSSSQANWLLKMRIPHQADGRRVIVSRAHVQAWLEGKQAVNGSGPNWAAVA